MTDFPSTQPTPLMIGSYSPHYSPMSQLVGVVSSAAVSFNWVANLAVYIPIHIPWPYTVARVWWANGSQVTGNSNFGIFTPSGKRIYSTGSTAQGSASALQFVAPTPFTLAPGAYYFAFSNDGTTNRVWGQGVTALRLNQIGVLQQASNFTLADPATFATSASAAYPLCGVTRVGTSLPF